MSELTAELFGSPVLGLATSMDTLSRELRHSFAQAEGVYMFIYAIVTMAEVSNTGRSEGVNVQQTVTAVEGRPHKNLLAQRFLQDRQTDRYGNRGKAKTGNSLIIPYSFWA